MKARYAVLVMLCATAGTLAGELPGGTVVRIEGSGIEAGWFTGKITTTSAGCTMVTLDKATKDGYTMLALIAVKRMEKQQGGGWVDQPLKPLLAKEPKPCLEEGSD